MSANAHPLKMSTCIIEKDVSGNVMVKFNFFLDDFQAHLESLSGKDLDFQSFLPATKKEVDRYVSKNFMILKESKKLSLSYHTSSVEKNIFHVEYKLSNPLKVLKGVTIINKLLMDAFTGQSNIVRVNLKGDKNYRTLKFEKGEEEQSF
jgi:hypothetical protein